tara:strand:- start:219 stop:422 length:204 start_codon:yes stop_codon:yes gene_type:complete
MKILYLLLPILIKGFYLSWSSLKKIHKMNSVNDTKDIDNTTYEDYFNDDENYISPELVEYLLNKSKN